MKKFFNFLKSMRFGIILLVLIAVCSVVGSVIPQGKDVSFYAQTYQSLHGVILMLKLNKIFTSWYFVTLMVLLCLNLTLCSILRIFRVVRDNKTATERAARMPDAVSLDSEGVAILKAHLEATHCKAERVGDVTVYRRHDIGRYGTFITHLAILLTVVFGAAALYLPEVTDETCFPGEALVMPDGTHIAVDSFHIENGSGQLDFASKVQITLPDGDKSELTEVSVNHPMRFGEYKVYQQTYGTAGSITVTNLDNNESETFTLNEVSQLADEKGNGIWYLALYAGYVKGEDGSMELISSVSGSYPDPVYQIMTMPEETPVLAFPGDTMTIANLKFTFNKPVEYPGLRIKHTPPVVNVLLIVVFVLMIAGLYITFFMQPVLVKVSGSGYTVGGPKPEAERLRLKTLLKSHESERK